MESTKSSFAERNDSTMRKGYESEPSSPSVEEMQHSTSEISYLQGWRLYAVTISILVGLFLGNLEIPIVNTALFSITGDLGDFDKAPWLISAYLLGYISVAVIGAKLSDIFGRKALLLIAFADFIVFSGACGGAQSVDQLIVFRALKGLGGSGIATLPIVTMYDLVPKEKYATWSAYSAIAFSFASILGPILGGVISRDSSWRWVFLLNVPVAIPFAAIIAMILPPGFPRHDDPIARRQSILSLINRRTLGRLDILGSVMLLVGTALFVAAFQEAGKDFEWNSAFVICLLIFSGLILIAFLTYEWYITCKANTRVEPVLPWRLVKNRVWLGLLIIGVFHGVAWIIPIYQIPQRFQVIHGASPLGAGTRLLPFTVLIPIGAIVASALAKRGIAPVFILLVMSLVQVVGYTTLGTLPYSPNILARQYGFQVIAGFGCGAMITLLPLMLPFVVETRDRGVGTTALSQSRYMGAVMGLSLVTTALNNSVRPELLSLNLPQSVDDILKYPQLIQALPPDLKEAALRVLANGFNLQMQIVAGLAGGEFLGALLLWRSVQIKVDGSQQAEQIPKERVDSN